MQGKQEFKEEAIPFVIYNPDKRVFEINEDAQDFLKQLQGPLGIIAVAGMYRTGKSYLLNRMLLNRAGGFGVGPTINPCTKGVWIWGKPIQGFTPEGEPINVLVLDTEGLGALDEDSNHDVRIFSLAILLSSFFIYNSVGSIDENALQNLSLVINLTKHIHLKSTGLAEDIDPEEYAQYFPSFMWVVRDFTLQLQDLEGEQITPKEYLEKALQPQKGFTDAVEQKNRIRRLLKSFFQERDCCTMIRPLTKEENLQTLEKMQLEDLRPEFVEQVMTLRRKVINRIKPKLMHGKKLNGEMLFNLALSYVHSINKGVVPNIESAWSYICKNECQKAQMEAYDKFEREFMNKFSQSQPIFDDELKDLYLECKKLALDDFSKVAVGDVQKEFMGSLKERIRNKYLGIKAENQKISEQQCLIFLQQNYQSIERKLKNQEYSSIYDVVEELKNFQIYFIENGPPGPNRMTVLMDFINKSLVEASEFLFRQYENELRLQKSINQESVQKLQQQLAEVKEDNQAKVDNIENKLRQAEIEKTEYAAKEQSIKEALQGKTKELQKLEQEYQERFDQIKKETARQLEESKNMIFQTEETTKEIQRQKIASDSEHDKQKALLEQKVQFYEKQLEDMQKKDKDLSNELKNMKKDHLSLQKESQKQFEQQIRDLQKKTEEYQEKLYEWENKFYELQQKYDSDVQRLEESESYLKKEFQKIRDVNNDYMKQNEKLRNDYQNDIVNFKSNSEEDIAQRDEKIQELEMLMKAQNEQFEQQKQAWQKDSAIYVQKLEFLEVQLRDERQKLDQQKQDHENMIQKFQLRERESVIGREDGQKRIQALQEQYNKEYQEMEAKFEANTQKLQDQIDQLTEKKQELEINLKMQSQGLDQELQNLRENYRISEEQKLKYQEQLKITEAQKMKLMEDFDVKHKSRENILEKEIQEKTSEYEIQIKEIQDRSEEQLQQLKIFYEMEKERLERRIQEEKERAQKRFNNMVDDYEQKLKDEIQQKDEDIEMMQDEFQQKEKELNEYIQQLRHENGLQLQQLQSLDAYLNETKESLNNMQNTSQLTLEKQLEKFNDERRELTQKIERQALDLQRKERELTSFENQKDSLAQQISQKDKIINELRNETNNEKGELSVKIEQLRAKNQELLDDLTQKRIEFERDKALKQQQLQFQEQRINELTQQLDDTIKRYEERVKTDREDYLRDTQEKVQRIQQEKEQWELKYDQKRKALKEVETNLNKQIQQMDRDRAVMLEKYQHLDQNQKDLIQQQENEITKLRETNDQLSSSLNSDKQSIHQEVEKWRNQFLDMERQHQDLNNNYDKDKALWDGKFKFLEQQKETAKKDLEDAQRKFQYTLESLQKNQQDKTSKSENAHQMLVQQMENKYSQRVKEIQEQNSNAVSELKNNIKELQRQNRVLSDKLELNSKSKQSEQGGLEKKLEKLQEEKDRLLAEIDEVKSERDKKIGEYQSILEKERENYKQKLRDTEGKGTRVEARQTEMILNHEKERAKWEHEKSYLISQKEDAVEHSQRLEKKVENLLRENEKLKNDNRQNKKNMYQATQNTTNYQAAMVGTKLLGQLQNQYGGFKAVNQSISSNAGGLTSAIQGLSQKFGGAAQNDGIDTQRTQYPSGYQGYLGKEKGGYNDEKSFISTGAVGALNQANLTKDQKENHEMNNPLESSLIKNILLSTPSSKKSGGLDDFSEDQSSKRE